MSYKETELYKLLRFVFKSPILVVVKGDWRTGKTDTSLLVAFLSLKWGLLDRVASNIFTFNDPLIKPISTTGELLKWGHADKTKKLYILDEGLKHLYRRKAMSALNVEFVSEVLPEISKAHLRVMILTQIAKIDTDVIDPAFCRSVWEKKSKKVMTCSTKNYPFKVFTHLPKSPIKFDPDRLAVFINKKLSKGGLSVKEDRTLQVCRLYGSNTPMNEIRDVTGLHPQQVKREIQKGLKWFVEHYSTQSEEVLDKSVNSPEIAPVQ